MKTFYLAVSFIICFLNGQAQVILNAYAKVSAITGSNVLTLTNVDETNHTFTVGGVVVVMQMQDDAIGSNTTNVSTFGSLGAIGNAGIYELRTIASRTPAAGVPTGITLSSALTSSFNTGANSSVQLISFRNLGSNFTTSSNITGLAWDGNVGGVIAIEVTNTLTLNHNISANVIGFRGGFRSASAGGGCDPTTYMTNSNLRGYKGEGIYKSTNANFTHGRGHILNGGGGGNEHNAGGAGGGNYTAGGDGGPGYNCGTAAGGLGGLGLSGQIAASRIFMGGGGGGGGQNNGFNADGTNGGGIILIKASALITNTVCGSPVMITANGGAAATVGNDGAGGGGAAGTIVLNVTTFSITPTCTLGINTNGGNGGNVTDGTAHAGGGGGGQGAIVYSTAQPTTNMVTTTNNGAGGANSSSGPNAGSGAGSNNSGIIPSASGPLPIELLEFKGQLQEDKVKLSWITASEKNNDFFTIERSLDGVNFTELGKVDGAGNSKSKLSYQFYDHSPESGVNYYKLSQTDFNGASGNYPVVQMQVDYMINEVIFPNPVDRDGVLTIVCENDYRKQYDAEIIDVTGRTIFSRTIPRSDSPEYKINLNDLEIRSGIYYLKLKGLYSTSVKKLVVQ